MEQPQRGKSPRISDDRQTPVRPDKGGGEGLPGHGVQSGLGVEENVQESPVYSCPETLSTGCMEIET